MLHLLPNRVTRGFALGHGQLLSAYTIKLLAEEAIDGLELWQIRLK